MATALERKTKNKPGRNGKPEPTWVIATFFPLQGDWTEEEYLALDRNCEPRLIELNNGFLEILPMPDMFHQDIMQFLFLALNGFVRGLQIGRVYVAPMPVKLWTKQMREPDIVFLASHRIKNKRKP